MPSSLSKNGGLTLFVTHMKIISFSRALRACFFIFNFKIKKKSKIKTFTKTRTRDLHKYSHVRYP